jgi:hypothetical protein
VYVNSTSAQLSAELVNFRVKLEASFRRPVFTGSSVCCEAQKTSDSSIFFEISNPKEELSVYILGNVSVE